MSAPSREELERRLLCFHFSDEESDRIITLDDSEVTAIGGHLWPLISEWIGDAQASEFEIGYKAGVKAGKRASRSEHIEWPDR